MNKTICFLVITSMILSCKPKETSHANVPAAPDWNISLAQWSLHKSFFGNTLNGDWARFGKMLMENPDSLLKGNLNPDDFPQIAAGYGVNTIELVNTFYFSKAKDTAYWTAFKKKCEVAGVRVGLIMCDALGDMGNADAAARKKAIENHYAWVDIAHALGAPTIRVNAGGAGTAEEVAKNAADGLSRLGEYASTKGINVVVENHGSYSSDGSWLAGVMKAVNKPNVGTLPDFGNFCIERDATGCKKEYDRYKGTAELMPFAKGVSAKTHIFDSLGNEAEMDYVRLMKIVKDAGFKGNIGIEYEGTKHTEDEGIKLTKALLDKIIAQK